MSQEPSNIPQADQQVELPTDKLLKEMLHSTQATERHL